MQSAFEHMTNQKLRCACTYMYDVIQDGAEKGYKGKTKTSKVHPMQRLANIRNCPLLTLNAIRGT